MLIDTHSHLYLKEFDTDRKEVVENAVKADIQKIILPNIDSSSVDGMMEMLQTFPDICYPLMGLHPTSVQSNYKEELRNVEKWLKKYKFCGIGEIGIDLYWDKTYKKEQIEAFRHQIDLSIKYQLPIVIHSRDSLNEIFEVLDDYQNSNLNGIFHCFPGNVAQAQKAISLGFFIGIGGIVTFKNSGLDKIVSQLSPENIVLETDSPYLAPAPYRGKRNESAYIKIIAQKIAEILNVDYEEIAEITTKNAMTIFNISSQSEKLI